jgi:hypothetical protein
MTDPTITADGGDAFWHPNVAQDIMYGSKNIERLLNCSPRFVKSLIKHPEAPVWSRAGRIITLKTVLLAWIFIEKAKQDAEIAA